jgi:hypothetical protein
MDRFNTYKKYITLLHAVPLRGVADEDGKRLVAEGVGEGEGWTGGWLERVGNGGMLEGGWREGGMEGLDWRVAGESGRWRGAGGCGWREDEGWKDFREWRERVKDGGM